MSTSIDQAFIRQYEAEVHQAYQRQGSKLRNTVRVKSGVRGSSTTFQTVGKGAAQTKSRHGLVPVMNIDHTPVECVLADYYAGDWVDKLDELKVNIDERMVTVNAGAWALGRQTDQLIIDQLATATQIIVHGGVGMTKAKVLSAFETLGANDVPDDGNRYAIVGYEQWTELLEIAEFADADFIGGDDLPWMGGTAKRWMGTMWIAHSGLPKVSTERSTFWYHRSAIGHAVGADVQSDITWHGDRAAHFISNMMSQGSIKIDDLGIVEIECTET